MGLASDELRERVVNNTSRDDGRVQDPRLELDARTVAILSQRRQISKDFGFTSLLGFSVLVLASWQSLAITFQAGLVNGGPSVLVYGFVLSAGGNLAIAASLAEVASISPTSGGQYHWIALLAPRRYAIWFSWFAGWMTALSRVAVFVSVAFLSGAMIQGLMILNYSSYSPQNWHGTFLYWAVLLLAILVNVLAIRVFPYIETIGLILQFFFFFMLLIPLVYLAPHSSVDFVFKSFANNGGWFSDGVSWCIGLLTSTYALAGVDSVCHMSEEVRNPAVEVPRSMFWSMALNSVLTLGFSIALLFSIGDPDQALQSPTGFPVIEIFFNATKSYAATNAMVSALIISFVFSSIGSLASASRFLWAFARDEGLPCSKYLSHVDHRFGIPVRAMVLIILIVVIIGLINLGSSTAFQAIVSLALLGQYSTYVVPTSLMLVRRLRKDKNIPFGPWELGKWGVPANVVAILFSLLTMAFNCLPPYFPVDSTNMNYAPVVFGAAVVLSTIAWFAQGSRHYAGPIRKVMADGNIRSTILDRESNVVSKQEAA